MFAGESPAERAPVFWLRLHKAALRNGARIVRESGPQAARSAAGDATRVALVWDGIDLAVGRSYAQAFADVGELDQWKYCPRCSAEIQVDAGKAECPACGFRAYASSKPTASAVCVDEEGRLLLSRFSKFARESCDLCIFA